jgi:hypothetical protein
MAKLNIKDAYLVLEGHFIHTEIVRKHLKNGSLFYACKIADKG